MPETLKLELPLGDAIGEGREVDNLPPVPKPSFQANTDKVVSILAANMFPLPGTSACK